MTLLMSHGRAQLQQSSRGPILSHPIPFCWPHNHGVRQRTSPEYVWSFCRDTGRSLNNRNGKLYFPDLHESSWLHSSPSQAMGTWAVTPSPAWGCTPHWDGPTQPLLWLQRRGGVPAPQDGLLQLCPSCCQHSLPGFLASRGTFLQHCPEVRLDCVGSWPQFTGTSAKLHHSIVTPRDGVTDRQSPAGFSKPKHFATLTGRKKTNHQPTTLSV